MKIKISDDTCLRPWQVFGSEFQTSKFLGVAKISNSLHKVHKFVLQKQTCVGKVQCLASLKWTSRIEMQYPALKCAAYLQNKLQECVVTAQWEKLGLLVEDGIGSIWWERGKCRDRTRQGGGWLGVKNCKMLSFMTDWKQVFFPYSDQWKFLSLS